MYFVFFQDWEFLLDGEHEAEPMYLSYPAHSLVSILTELSHPLKCGGVKIIKYCHVYERPQTGFGLIT
jgi:hypothetical protein